MKTEAQKRYDKLAASIQPIREEMKDIVDQEFEAWTPTEEQKEEVEGSFGNGLTKAKVQNISPDTTPGRGLQPQFQRIVQAIMVNQMTYLNLKAQSLNDQEAIGMKFGWRMETDITAWYDVNFYLFGFKIISKHYTAATGEEYKLIWIKLFGRFIYG